MAATSDLDKRISALQKTLTKARERRSQRQFLPPYTDAELAAAEQKLGVPLPDEMRAFVTRVSTGEVDSGDPPMYPPHDGLKCLGPDDKPSEPFPLKDKDARALIVKDMKRKKGSRGPAAEVPMNGILPVMDHGDGEYDCVVLTGPQRGMMWKWWEDGVTPIYVVEKKQPRHLDYLSWIEREMKAVLDSAPPPIDVRAKEISLSGQNLTVVPPDVFAAKKAEKLDLNGNRLTELPEELGQLTTLKTLLLGANHLNTLPTAIGHLSKLELLSASSNQIESLPNTIGDLAALARLLLAGNKLQHLPKTIGKLARLAELDVTNNHLAELPDVFGGMRSLRTLKIAKNPLSELPPSLADAPIDALDLDELPELDLDRALGVIGNSATITTLGIKRLNATLPASLASLTRVKVLRLVALGLSEVPPEVLRLPSLERLSLDQNQIATLPEALLRMPHLKSVVLFSNPIEPAAVAELRAHWPKIEFSR